MLKLIGIMGMVIASGLLGLFKTGQLRRRRQLLEEYLEMIIEIKGRINYFRQPLPDIFGRVSRDKADPATRLTEAVAGELKEKNHEIAAVWPEKINQVYGKEPMTDDDMEIFKYPGTFIGQTDFDNHIQHFEYIERKLQAQISDARECLKNKGPMYNKIGFFIGGIGAVLLM